MKVLEGSLLFYIEGKAQWLSDRYRIVIYLSELMTRDGVVVNSDEISLGRYFKSKLITYYNEELPTLFDNESWFNSDYYYYRKRHCLIYFIFIYFFIRNSATYIYLFLSVH